MIEIRTVLTLAFRRTGEAEALALEHALIMLLLLVALLSIRGPQRRVVPWLVLMGIGLSLLTPSHALGVGWSLISALVLPPLLWQVGLRIATVSRRYTRRHVVVWALTAILIAIALTMSTSVLLARALLLGLLAASLTCQVDKEPHLSTYPVDLATLTVALLLVEVDLAALPAAPFLGTVFSGAGVGLILGYLAVVFALRFLPGVRLGFLCGVTAYGSYLSGVLIGGSGVVSVTMAALVVALYGYHAGLWSSRAVLPSLLEGRGIFLVAGAIWLVLGWQAHVPLNWNHFAGIGSALAAGAVGILVMRWLAPPLRQENTATHQALLRKEARGFLLLSGALLLWPQEAVLDLAALLVALVAALTALLVLPIILISVFDLFEVELRLPGPYGPQAKRQE